MVMRSVWIIRTRRWRGTSCNEKCPEQNQYCNNFFYHKFLSPIPFYEKNGYRETRCQGIWAKNFGSLLGDDLVCFSVSLFPHLLLSPGRHILDNPPNLLTLGFCASKGLSPSQISILSLLLSESRLVHRDRACNGKTLLISQSNNGQNFREAGILLGLPLAEFDAQSIRIPDLGTL